MPILRVATRTGLVACTVLIALTTAACGPDRATPPPAPAPPVAPPKALPAPPDLDAPVEAGPAEAARPAEAKVVPTSLQVEDLEKVRRGVGWRPVAAVDNPDGDYACQRRALDSFGTVGGTSVAAEGQVDELTTFDVSQKIGIFPDELNAGAAVKGLAADIENCGTQVGDVVVTQVGSAGSDSRAWLLASPEGSPDATAFADYVGIGRDGQVVTVVVFRAYDFAPGAFAAPPSITLLRAALARLKG